MEPIDISRLDTAELYFPNGEVLERGLDRRERSRIIHKATYFGNITHQKVLILFKTEQEVYQVNTTIWLHYNGKIFLKDNISIPVERILEVRMD